MSAVNLHETFYKHSQAVGILELVCQALEITDTQHKLAVDRYNAVGKWLAESSNPYLQQIDIYPQGSMGLRTTVKPLHASEFDLDLVCLVLSVREWISPADLKKLIGDRLNEHEKYKAIRQEKPRCWRLCYADEFHLDITPSIPNHGCNNGGELVPDKRLKTWKASNPRGYRNKFEARAALTARFRIDETSFTQARANIEAVPGPTKFKGLLRRCVQLCKRHRDLWAESENSEYAPISIIITTLAAQSYEYCVANHIYDTELDLLVDVVRNMHSFIEIHRNNLQTQYYVWNETTKGENFAEKWNQDPRYAQAFYRWNESAKTAIETVISNQGIDKLLKTLSLNFGESAVNRAMSQITELVSGKRQTSGLFIAPGIGLSASSVSSSPVRPNTFYGRRED